MSVTIVSADREALHAWESAQTEAEQKRHDYAEARDDQHVPSYEYVAKALLYAQAADNAERLRQRYEALILEEMAKELGG